MNTAIAIAGSVPQVITNAGAITARDSLLAESSTVVAIKTAIDYESAGAVVADLKRMILDVEKSRKAIKAPVLELGSAIDSAAADFVADVKAEVGRLGPLLVTYDQEQARIRAEAERKAQEEAERAERARREAEAAEARKVAEAKEAEERAKRDAEEAVRVANATQDPAARVEAQEAAQKAEQATQAAEDAQRAANLAAMQTKPAATVAVVPPPAPKVQGLRLRQVQCHEVQDVVALYKARPDLVQLVPIVGAINKAIEAGETLPGVLGWKEGRA